MSDPIPNLISSAAPRHIHLLGIGGSGMNGLAYLLAQAGHRISGSDAVESPDTAQLRAMGIAVRCGHSASLDARPDLAVFSAAISNDNPELTALRNAGVTTIRRGDFLPALMKERDGIAVSGTHGKTTTTAMIAFILKHAGLSPSFCVGGDVPVLGGKSELGKGRWFVAEACESDGTLACYAPRFGVILNVEEEHLDYYDDLDSILAVFARFAANTRDRVFYCSDDAGATRVSRSLMNRVSFGLNGPADFSVTDLQLEKGGSTFAVLCHGQRLGRISLRLPGAHNVSNALGAIAVTLEAGAPFERIAEALAEFTGAKRRFERKFEGNDILVVDDYAHHPTEIRATIASARLLGKKRVVVAFQPHRFTRTKWLRHQFASAFAMADKVFLTEIYAASERPIDGVNGRTIFDAVTATGQRGVEYEPSLESLTQRLSVEVCAGDLVLILGAGSISKVADGLASEFSIKQRTGGNGNHTTASASPWEKLAMADELRHTLSAATDVRTDEPMAKHTTLCVGGLADYWVEPASLTDLAALLKFCHEKQLRVVVVGRGSNLLVKDSGIRGVAVHLRHPEFMRVEIHGAQIIAGAGARLRQIVSAATKAGLSGFEFWEGIPGSLGGALRMNAGAMGRSTFDVVVSVQCMDFLGNIFEVPREDIEVGYRGCSLFKNGHGAPNKIALAATLRGVKSNPELVSRTLRDFEQKRRNSQPAAPSAGCIFRNPSPELPAGKLIDQMGLKGTRVGGAYVSDKHANFIVTENGAKAGDVLGLIEVIRERAWRERGVALTPEVEILGE
jgi:UDP-N-acetylmuramate--L-alanine ligase/UDP-N-acetylenolpyruvoylglucosamine reductase